MHTSNRLSLVFLPFGGVTTAHYRVESAMSRYAPYLSGIVYGGGAAAHWGDLFIYLFWDFELHSPGGLTVQSWRRKRFNSYTEFYNFVQSIATLGLSGNLVATGYLEKKPSIPTINYITGSNVLYDSFMGRKYTYKYTLTLRAAEALGLTSRSSSDYENFARALWRAAWFSIPFGAADELKRGVWILSTHKGWRLHRPLGKQAPIIGSNMDPNGFSDVGRMDYDSSNDTWTEVGWDNYLWDDEAGVVYIQEPNHNLFNVYTRRSIWQLRQLVGQVDSIVMAYPIRHWTNNDRRAVFLKPAFGIDHIAFDQGIYSLVKYKILAVGSATDAHNTYWARVLDPGVDGDDKFTAWVKLRQLLYPRRALMGVHGVGEGYPWATSELRFYVMDPRGGYISEESPWMVRQRQYMGMPIREVVRIGISAQATGKV